MSDRSFILHLNSKYANSSDNGEDTFAFNPIKSSEENEIWISIIHFICPYSWYNINNDNNKLVLYIQDDFYTFYITPGNYNGITLATQIQTTVNAYTDPTKFFIPIVNFSCSYDTKTSKLTFNNNYYYYVDSSSTILNVIGFHSQANSSLSSLKYILTSTYPINLIPHHCICISSNIETDNIHLSISQYNKSVLASIPVDVSPMGLIIYKPLDIVKVNTNNNILNYIVIKLIDQSGNVIDLNGQHYTIAFQIDIIKYTE
jgi:hypothetical protein